MATSGSTNWSLTRDEIIAGALRKIGVLSSGQTATANQVTDAAVALNALVKAFQADGMAVWKLASYSFTTTTSTSSYTIGLSQTLNTAAPLKVTQATYTPSGGKSTPMNVYNRYDYFQLPSGSSGSPINLYYQPLRANGTIRLWPTPDNSTTSITIYYQSLYEDFDASSDDADFPSYWINALIYNLAWTLAPEYGVPISDRTLLSKEALYWKDIALSFGSEEGSLFLAPAQE